MTKEAPSDGKRRPHGTFHLLMHIGHLLEERCRSGLAEYGLHHGQARVLMALDREEGLIQARMATGMDIAPATLSIMLKKLVKHGLVERTSDQNDQRVQCISLTVDGRKAVKRVKEVWGAADESIVASLGNQISARDRELLHQCLLNIRNGLGGKSPEL